MHDVVSDILTDFLKGYQPAKDIINTTEFLSMAEIVEKVNDSIPEMTAEQNYECREVVFEMLKRRGFKYKLIKGEVEWLLKEKLK